MSWHLRGSYVETCSCELMCPCNLSLDHGATYDFCRVTLVFNIREGAVDDTDISGGKVAIIADTPKVMTEGNWRVGVFVGEDASDAQFDQLVRVFSGQLGGPMAGLAPLIGEMLGVERAAIEINDDGLRHCVRVGELAALVVVLAGVVRCCARSSGPTRRPQSRARSCARIKFRWPASRNGRSAGASSALRTASAGSAAAASTSRARSSIPSSRLSTGGAGRSTSVCSASR